MAHFSTHIFYSYGGRIFDLCPEGAEEFCIPFPRDLSAGDEFCVVGQRDDDHDGDDFLAVGITGASLLTFNSRSCMFTTVGVSLIGAYELTAHTRVASHLDWLESVVWGVEEEVKVASPARAGSITFPSD